MTPTTHDIFAIVKAALGRVPGLAGVLGPAAVDVAEVIAEAIARRAGGDDLDEVLAPLKRAPLPNLDAVALRLKMADREATPTDRPPPGEE